MSEWAVFAAISARIAARGGQRPAETTWQHLEGITDFGHLVQSARGTGLAPWVEHLGPRPDPHQIEAGLREGLRTAVEQVARWQPMRWRPALRWCALLPELPTVQHLLAGGEVQPWMESLPTLQPLLADTVRQRRERALASPLAPMARSWGAGEPLWLGWSRRWHRLWPVTGRAARPLRRLEASIARHRELLLEAGHADRSEPAGKRFRRAAADLDRLTRRHARHPAASYAHLARTALDYQRLRGLLMHRRLMPATEVQA